MEKKKERINRMNEKEGEGMREGPYFVLCRIPVYSILIIFLSFYLLSLLSSLLPWFSLSFNNIGPEGAVAIAHMLRENRTINTLK